MRTAALDEVDVLILMFFVVMSIYSFPELVDVCFFHEPFSYRSRNMKYLPPGINPGNEYVLVVLLPTLILAVFEYVDIVDLRKAKRYVYVILEGFFHDKLHAVCDRLE